MNLLQNREVCFNQERLSITYHSIRHESLVRSKSKSPNWQGSQPISYKTKFSQRDKIYHVDLKYNINYQYIRAKTKVRPIFYATKSLKWPKSYVRKSFLQNHDVSFNQESLPITYYNFHHKNLVRPKSKSTNWQGSQPISYKVNFSHRETMHLLDVKFKYNLPK